MNETGAVRMSTEPPHVVITNVTSRVTVLPIPWTSINDYAKRHEILGRDFDVFKDLVRALDKAALRRSRNDGDPGAVQQEDGTDSGTH